MNNLVIEQNKRLAFVSAFLISLCFVLGFFVSKGYFSIDQSIQNFAISTRNDFLTSLMVIITNFASPLVLQAYSILMFLFLVSINKLSESVNFVVSMCAGVISFFSFKLFFTISRPIDRLTDVAGWSFPSGHTTMATIAFLLTIYFLKDHIKNLFHRKIFIEFFAMLIALVAVSRIYLGAHFFSDVLGGFFLGVAIVLVSVIVARIK